MPRGPSWVLYLCVPSLDLSQQICDGGFMTLVQQMRKLNFTGVWNLPELPALVGHLIAGLCSLHPPGTRPSAGC